MAHDSKTESSQRRRDDERVRMAPMYTAVTASRSASAAMHGHIYDISASGVRIELDEPLPPGEHVSLELQLPGAPTTVQASADVIWCHDEQDDPGPRRMALRFVEFSDRGHQKRLADFLIRERGRRAA